MNEPELEQQRWAEAERGTRIVSTLSWSKGTNLKSCRPLPTSKYKRLQKINKYQINKHCQLHCQLKVKKRKVSANLSTDEDGLRNGVGRIRSWLLSFLLIGVHTWHNLLPLTVDKTYKQDGPHFCD